MRDNYQLSQRIKRIKRKKLSPVSLEIREYLKPINLKLGFIISHRAGFTDKEYRLKYYSYR